MLSIVFVTTTLPTKLRLNYGVIFRDGGKIDITSHSWKHVFQIPLPETPKFNYTIFDHIDCQQSGILFFTLKRIQTFELEVEEIYQNYTNVVELLLPESKDSKSKRGLINIGGTILKGLFGLSTENDVKKLHNFITKVANQQVAVEEELKIHEEHVLSAIKIEDNRINNAFAAIQLTRQDVNEQLVTMDQKIHSLMELYQLSHSIIRKYMSYIDVFRQQMEHFMTGVEGIIQGQISPKLVSPEAWRLTLQQLQYKLRQTDRDYVITHTHLSYYYSDSISYTYYRYDNSLYIIVRIPIQITNYIFDLWNVQSFPIPVQKDSKHVTKITNLKPYFAMDITRALYLELTVEDVLMCTGVQIKQCKLLTAIPVSHSSCLSALFLEKTELVHKLCDIHFLPYMVLSYVIELNEGSIFIVNASKIIKSCKNEIVTQNQGCTSCVIELQCHCSITTELYFIPPRIDNCNYNSSSTLHVINLAIIHHLFDFDKISMIQTNSLFANETSMIIPEFKVHSDKFEKYTKLNTKYEISVKNAIDQMKKDKIISHFSNEIVDASFEFGMPEYMLYISILIIAILAGIGFIYLCVKVKRLTAIITVINAKMHADAESVLNYTMFSHKQKITNVNENSKIATPLIAISVDTLIIMISIIILMLIAYAITRRKKIQQYLRALLCSKNAVTDIYMEIRNNHLTFAIKLATCSLCSHDIELKVPESATDYQLIDHIRLRKLFYKGVLTT
ncbi:MAG: hypothetical protein ABW185_19570 [Sedimenticola sp.]